MKFAFVFLLLLDIPHLKGQQRTEEFEHILLRFTFPSFYNSYNKSCCKLYPGGCYKLLDSAGYTCDSLKGRVTKTEKDGWIEFKISNVQLLDRGYYRCIVLGTPNQIYNDYYVEVSDASNHNSQFQPPLTTAINVPTTSKPLSESTGPVLAQDHSDSPRVPWTFGLLLATIVSLTMVILIASVTGIVCCRVRTKRKQLDKCGETLCESQKQEDQESSSIVYTTVDFRNQKPTEVYANLRIQKTRPGDSDSTWSAGQAGMVEYSTLAIHQ
ncbi:uncharacterized protein LOC113145164 [Mastacembelus armatus]|uniref:uncharacterized protein LOC113145164 n=1 Tax=Mastacembelus armatus TaxID=205130 RepID=UPI000E45E278|nr:uncharacterized protein LOC113145164 [Mastacembelus armatus]